MLKRGLLAPAHGQHPTDPDKVVVTEAGQRFLREYRMRPAQRGKR